MWAWARARGWFVWMRARAIPVETTNININVDAHVDLLPAREKEKMMSIHTLMKLAELREKILS